MIFKGCDFGGNHSMGLFQMANMIALAFGVAARYKLLLLYSHFLTKSSLYLAENMYCLKKSEGPFTLCLNDVRPSTATTVGWLFTGSAFTIEIRK